MDRRNQDGSLPDVAADALPGLASRSPHSPLLEAASGTGAWRKVLFWGTLSLLPIFAAVFYVFLQNAMAPAPVAGVEITDVQWRRGVPGQDRGADLEALIADGRWQPMPITPTPRGERRSTWMRLTVANATSDEDRFALEWGSLYLDTLSLLEPSEDGDPKVRRSGQSVPWEERAALGLRPSVRFELARGETRQLYLYLEDVYPITDPIHLRAARHQDAIEFWEIAQYMGYFGILGGLAVFHLFWYAVIRLKVYRYYLFYLGCTGAFFLAGGNFNLIFFPWIGDTSRAIAIAVTLSLTFWSLGLFASQFLGLKEHIRWLDRSLRLIGSLLCVLGLVAVLCSGHVIVQSRVFEYILIGGFATLGLVVIAGALRWRRGSVAAGRFLFALLPFVAAFAWIISAQFAWGPVDHTNGFPMLAGSALECILLGLVVAFDYRDLQRRHASLEKSYLANLEAEVARQTAALKTASGELRCALRDRERLLQIIGHDLRGPVANTISVGDYLAGGMGKADAVEIAAFGRELRRRGRMQLDLLENLLAWGAVRGQSNESPGMRPFLIREVVDRILLLNEPTAKEKGITLRNQLSPELRLVRGERAIETILRNFVSNAVKFTSRGGQIEVREAASGSAWGIEAADNGMGMSPDQLARLRSAAAIDPMAGTENEFGSGLGLTFCRELAGQLGGQLTFESEIGQGTLARLVLPSNVLLAAKPVEAALAPLEA